MSNKLEMELEELLKKVEDKKREIENYKSNKNPWVRKCDYEKEPFVKYWVILADGNIMDFSGIHKYIDNLNLYKTKESAEKQFKKELLLRKLENFAYENNANITEEDWKHESCKYFIMKRKENLLVSCKYDRRELGQVYFNSREIAEKALGVFKEEIEEYFNL